ncbi:mechanosensitive ion channel, partial [Salmonella enterica subsp. enterica serovar Anatum]|nr:mechanosensitive ion channel [Salmonella enterica subsp. enterica serovar Anatum]
MMLLSILANVGVDITALVASLGVGGIAIALAVQTVLSDVFASHTGFKSATWGTLTFGQQNSIYYDVVGVKTDIWDYDMIGQAPG